MPDDPRAYFAAVCCGPHLERLPQELRDAFVERVCERAEPELDYVRLNMKARKPA